MDTIVSWGDLITSYIRWGQLQSAYVNFLTFQIGLLMAVDSYMNLQLENTEEFINEEFAGNLGQVLIRCNNVLYLRAGEEKDLAEKDDEDS